MSTTDNESSDLGDWTFKEDEVSAGVYRVVGFDTAGRSVESSGVDPDALLEECKQWARETMLRERSSRRP
jgi:hypothetical protein